MTIIKTHNICIMGLILYYRVTAQRTMSLCIFKEIINLYFFTKPKFMMYCGIIIVRLGPMFVAFLGRHCEQIYIPTNVHCICKHMSNIYSRNRTRYQQNYIPTNQENFDYPWTLTPSNKKWFHSIWSRNSIKSLWWKCIQTYDF